MDKESRLWRRHADLELLVFQSGTKDTLEQDTVWWLQRYILKDFWEWDQATNVWTKKADFGGTHELVLLVFQSETKDTLELDR